MGEWKDRKVDGGWRVGWMDICDGLVDTWTGRWAER